MRRFVLLVLCVAPAILPARAGEAAGAPLSLRDAASLALKESPRIGQARAGEAIAAARATQARSAWLPEIGVSETVSRGNNPVFVFGSLLEQGRFGAANFDPAFLNEPPSLTNWRRAVSLRYPLFDQLRRYTSIETSRDAVSQAHEMSDAARQELRLRVVRAYFGLQLARRHAVVERSRSRAHGPYRRGASGRRGGAICRNVGGR